MSAIYEIYNRAHNIMKLAVFYQMFSSQQVKGNVILSNKNSKYKFSSDLRTLHEILRFYKIFCQWLDVN